ncbi:adenosylcobinamide-GDP ribazoletransferase [Nocardia sp. alder85J]|uniref:adenosylcobinamide-GDP ribazoletransferase n=1 Tax=Nocardia sp. alder85J TaxID=2862949 RepID=UPI001CD52B5B|nr:adenosylcobinamide-GDP ribazoletransferase [Nocardia sp. alder85J]MCX4098691.1 adenosylcobinamide-GDP ribazoletransferase [Nocardia sp. alder85J]
MTGLRLAVSWLTVLPVRGPETVDRSAAKRAIACAPVVGVLLGAAASAVLWTVGAAGGTDLLGGLLAVAGLALATRGMHLDGLADTFDGLGSYGPPERAREIMKSGGAGPFGVAALIFAIGIQALALGSLAGSRRWFAIVLALALGRIAVVLACRMAAEAAPGAGFGALVAGTQSMTTTAVWVVGALAASVFAVPGTWWLGPVAVVASLNLAAVLVRHCTRRFDGLNGDVLGAALELTVTAAAALLSLRP